MIAISFITRLLVAIVQSPEAQDVITRGTQRAVRDATAYLVRQVRNGSRKQRNIRSVK